MENDGPDGSLQKDDAGRDVHEHPSEVPCVLWGEKSQRTHGSPLCWATNGPDPAADLIYTGSIDQNSGSIRATPTDRINVIPDRSTTVFGAALVVQTITPTAVA